MKVIKSVKEYGVELLCIENLPQLRVGIFNTDSGYNVVLQYVNFDGKIVNIDLYKSTNLATVESFQRWLASSTDFTIWTIEQND